MRLESARPGVTSPLKTLLGERPPSRLTFPSTKWGEVNTRLDVEADMSNDIPKLLPQPRPARSECSVKVGIMAGTAGERQRLHPTLSFSRNTHPGVPQRHKLAALSNIWLEGHWGEGAGRTWGAGQVGEGKRRRRKGVFREKRKPHTKPTEFQPIIPPAAAVH